LETGSTGLTADKLKVSPLYGQRLHIFGHAVIGEESANIVCVLGTVFDVCRAHECAGLPDFVGGNVAFRDRVQPHHPQEFFGVDTIGFPVRVSNLVQLFSVGNSHIQMFRQRLVDMVVIAGCLNIGVCASVPLGEVAEVRVATRTSSTTSPSSSRTASYACRLWRSMPK
jgi:hypothetical protein